MTLILNLTDAQKLLSNFLQPQRYDDEETYQEIEEAVSLITNEDMDLNENQLKLLLQMTMGLIEVLGVIAENEDSEVRESVAEMLHNAILFLEYLTTMEDGIAAPKQLN